MTVLTPFPLSRRQFVSGLAAGSALAGLGSVLRPAAAFAPPRAAQKVLRGSRFALEIDYLPVNFTGKPRIALAINGSVPAPVLRWQEGERVTLRVINHLTEDSSIHWHGIILPTNMDGVPGLSFDGIKPGETFEYRFDVQQSGTYWYHSHSGFQEPLGMYGAIIIDPKTPEPVGYDREYVVMLSDWSDETPQAIYARLKKHSEYYNFRARTVANLWHDVQRRGVAQTWKARAMWNRMRMSETDIADVSGYTYTYLMNGMTPGEGWTGLFKHGERVRLRFINGASMTIFDVRIPGLKMTVVAADGQPVEPLSVDEFRLGVAETYDVVVQPHSDSAYTLFAQSIDRSGYARGTLTPTADWTAPVPEPDPPPVLGHRDMGMSHHGHKASTRENAGYHGQHGMVMQGHGHHPDSEAALAKAGFGNGAAITHVTHVADEFGPQVDMRVESPRNGLHDPGIGLRDHQQKYGRRVLTYADLKNLYPSLDTRDPDREIVLHLTGNMHRYMWSMNGIGFADADPVPLQYGERVRITLVNDTMMTHPMHLHGMWSELETGAPHYIPRKHTVLVQPGSSISYLVSADAPGRWAYHCHLTFHMPGMFREIQVR